MKCMKGAQNGDGDAAQEAVGLERGPGVLRPTARAEPAVQVWMTRGWRHQCQPTCGLRMRTCG
eukprot:3784585-Alexandrium_andersonii.AAC.1